MLSKLDIVPRWIILTIDLGLTLFALLLAKILKKDFVLQDIDQVAFFKSAVLTMMVNILVFTGLRTFSGIVRYTSTEDSFRIFFSMMLSSFLIFCTHAVLTAFGAAAFISNVVIVIYTLFSFIFLITYRVFVKYFFIYVKNLKIERQRIIVYGAGEAGLATKKTFDHASAHYKKIIAFVDDDPRKVGKEIDGVKILDASKLEMLIAKHELDEIIFASYTIPIERKNQIVDLCLEYNVKVLNIPSQEAWDHGKVKINDIRDIKIEDLLNRESIQIDTESIGQALRGKRILITGAAGSIGSEIVRQLMKFETGLIIMCDQSETALHNLQLELAETCDEGSCHAFIGDIKDKSRMELLFERYSPQYIYHAAAYKHVPMMEENAAEAVKTNVMGTKIVADLAVRYQAEKFVMISTDKAVNPTNVMGASKRIAEIYVQSLNNSLSRPGRGYQNGQRNRGDSAIVSPTRFITTRFGNVLGSNGSVIPRFKQQIERGGPITVTHPEITRYFMTIPEACRLVLEAGNMGEGGEIFIFDMGKSVKIIDLALKMIRLAGLIPHEDIKIVFTGLRPGEKLYEELLNAKENVLPTYHQKIMIGKVREYDFIEVEKQVSSLLTQALFNNVTQTVMQMKEIVPEFKSKNSVFTRLDLVH